MGKHNKGISDEHRALVKELGAHSHHPHLWVHLLNDREYRYLLSRIAHYNYPTKFITSEIIHIKADGSDRITVIFEKPNPFEGKNYADWESIKNDIQKFRKAKKKEREEMLERVKTCKELVPVPTPGYGVDPAWIRPGCEFCSKQDEFNKDLVASVVEVNGRILFGAQTYIEDNELKLYLDNSNNDFMQMDSVKINYCPICGRRLSGGGEDGNNETNN